MNQPTGRELSHAEWFDRFCDPAAKLIWGKMLSMLGHYTRNPASAFSHFEYPLVVELIGPKERWERPSEVLALAERFDPMTFDFTSLGLTDAATRTFHEARAAARAAKEAPCP